MPDLYNDYFYGDDVFSFFSRIFDAYYKGGWVVVDFILWYLIFYEVMVKAYARAFKSNYGDEGGSTKLSKAIAAILAVSMILLEQVAGFNMLMVSPIAALVACVVLWMGLYYFFKGKAERDGEETHTPWLLIATGIIPAMIFFSLMKKLSESAVNGNLPVAAAFVRPLGMTMSIINFGLSMMVLVGTILLFMWLFSKMRGWFGSSSADAGRDSEKAFEGAKKSFEEAADTMTKKVMDKLNIMDTKLDEIKKGVDAITGMLKNFVDTWKTEIGGLLTSATAELKSAMTNAEGNIKTAIDLATKAVLDKLSTELPKIEAWLNSARDALLKSMTDLVNKAKNEVLGETAKILSEVGNTTKALDGIDKRLEKAEEALKRLETKTSTPADVAKINEILTKISDLKASVAAQSKSLKEHERKEGERHNQLKTLLNTLNPENAIRDFEVKIVELRRALEAAIAGIPKGVIVNAPINFGTVVAQIGDVEQKGITVMSSAENAEEIIRRLEQICGGEAGLKDAIASAITEALQSTKDSEKAIEEAEKMTRVEVDAKKKASATSSARLSQDVALLEKLQLLQTSMVQAQNQSRVLLSSLKTGASISERSSRNDISSTWATVMQNAESNLKAWSITGNTFGKFIHDLDLLLSEYKDNQSAAKALRKAETNVQKVATLAEEIKDAMVHISEKINSVNTEVSQRLRTNEFNATAVQSIAVKLQSLIPSLQSICAMKPTPLFSAIEKSIRTVANITK